MNDLRQIMEWVDKKETGKIFIWLVENIRKLQSEIRILKVQVKFLYPILLALLSILVYQNFK